MLDAGRQRQGRSAFGDDRAGQCLGVLPRLGFVPIDDGHTCAGPGQDPAHGRADTPRAPVTNAVLPDKSMPIMDAMLYGSGETNSTPRHSQAARSSTRWFP